MVYQFCHRHFTSAGSIFLPVPVEITDKKFAVCKECNRDVLVYERKGEKWMYKVNNFYEHKEKCPPVNAVIDGMHEASKACAISKNRNKASKCVVLLEDCRNSD
ncbi:hypothetical protein pipiens_017722 [Culex pipiens pipiens]|uniref:Uncharacterized protein n=1 Tax=Culex pipiens pipiens TaxID=38569 RepID=A0ABD1CFC4_CULPP